MYMLSPSLDVQTSGFYRLDISYIPLFLLVRHVIVKVQFAIMKLTGQAIQYWENLERMNRFRRDDPVETWDDMNDKLRLKYLLPSFSQQLLDKWNMLTQGNKSATDYITKFDEYLNRCSAIELVFRTDPIYAQVRSQGQLLLGANNSRRQDSRLWNMHSSTSLLIRLGGGRSLLKFLIQAVGYWCHDNAKVSNEPTVESGC